MSDSFDPRGSGGSVVAGRGTDGRSPDPDSPAAASPPSVLGTRIPGHVSVAPRVLTRVGGAIVGEALEVDRRDVRVEAYDDDGLLAIRVWTPLAIPALTRDVEVANGGVLATARELQGTVTTRILQIAGRDVSRVDVTVTGSRSGLEPARRVR